MKRYLLMIKNEIILQDQLRIFKRIEIEINTNCNRKCSYCPNSIFINRQFYMNMALFQKIINELYYLQFSGRLSYHFYNEPLLHPNIEDFVIYTHEKLPKVEQVLYTNGDFLTDRKYKELLKAGINHFAVTNHGGIKLLTRPKQTILSPSNDLKITNRGGSLFKLKKSLKYPCYVPSERLTVTYNGDVVVCYEDAKRENVLGNIRRDSIEKIWFSDRYLQIRKQLSRGLRSLVMPCRFCDNMAHVTSNHVSLITVN